MIQTLSIPKRLFKVWQKPAPMPPPADWHVMLREQLMASFNVDELEEVCFDLRCDYEVLPGEDKSRKVIELIKFVARNGCVTELIDRCSQERPGVNWQPIRRGEIAHPFTFDVDEDNDELRAVAHVSRGRKLVRWLFHCLQCIVICGLLAASMQNVIEVGVISPPSVCVKRDVVALMSPQNIPVHTTLRRWQCGRAAK